nr:MAG TPA: hypothetical protein [Caudoviricetes sp.]
MLYYNCTIRVHIAIRHTDIEREEFAMKNAISHPWIFIACATP